MKISTIPSIMAALFFLLPCAVSAQDDPEAVFGKFHRAMLTGNLDDMIKYGTPGGGTDIAKLPADQRKKVLDSIKNITPKRYKLTARQLSSDGNRLTMRGTGTGATILGEAALPQDGEILMVKQSGEWKVDEVNWKGRKPGAAPATSTMSPAPEKKLGAAKEPCVYKSVMTDEDMARYR